MSDQVRLPIVRCLTLIFTRDPHLVFSSYQHGWFELQILMDAVRDVNTELALAAIKFWQSFIMLEGVTYKEEFKKNLFDQ